MTTYWKETITMDKYSKLQHDTETGILIIGGGLLGLLCAYKLEERNINYMLVEGDTIAARASSMNTGKITAQHGLKYQTLLKDIGYSGAKLYLDAYLHAVDEYRQLCQNMDVDFENQNAYCYSLDDRDVLEEEYRALKALNYEAHMVEELPLPFKTVGAIAFPNQAYFNPAKFCANIAKGLTIYEHTLITNIDGTTAITEDGLHIKAKKIIIACHFPFINSSGLYFVKMYQERGYGIVLDHVDRFEGMYIDESQKGLSLRFHKDHLIVYGRTERVGTSEDYFRQARSFAKFHYPKAKEIATLANEDCMTLDGLPYIGRYSSITPEIYVGTGFGKWGITGSMVASNLLCDIIENKTNPLEKLFLPTRPMMPSKTFRNMAKATQNMVRSSSKRCTHLGCALRYNSAENSWDCPCHGSRFTEDGEVLNGPANRCLK